MSRETPVTFECSGDRLVGILHAARSDAKVGIVLVVGGPQYRVGSHRQFVIMARQFASAGIPVLRFDYRGMADSEGRLRTFDDVGADIRAAIECFQVHMPDIDKVVLLGLCDAASANLMYAATDEHVHGLVLLNPWVRTVRGEAKAYLKHYYFQRLLQKAFWRKVLSGEFEVFRSAKQFLMTFLDARGSRPEANRNHDDASKSFVGQMLTGISKFRGPILLLLSGRDLTAQEFVELCDEDRAWNECLKRENVVVQRFPDADHTMSSRAHLDAASSAAIDWIASACRMTETP